MSDFFFFFFQNFCVCRVIFATSKKKKKENTRPTDPNWQVCLPLKQFFFFFFCGLTATEVTLH